MPTSPKTGIKTAKPSPKGGARLPVGAHPKNTGGKKGRSGRKPLAFKEFAVSLAKDPAFQDRLKLAAMSGDLHAIKLVVQYAEGMPTQPIETHDRTIDDLLLELAESDAPAAAPPEAQAA